MLSGEKMIRCATIAKRFVWGADTIIYRNQRRPYVTKLFITQEIIPIKCNFEIDIPYKARQLLIWFVKPDTCCTSILSNENETTYWSILGMGYLDYKMWRKLRMTCLNQLLSANCLPENLVKYLINGKFGKISSTQWFCRKDSGVTIIVTLSVYARAKMRCRSRNRLLCSLNLTCLNIDHGM